MSNSPLLSSNGLKPHSYAVNFSVSSAFDESKKDNKKIIDESATLREKNRNIER